MDMILEGYASTPQKVPTLLKWLESDESLKLKSKYWVKKIWYPNKFPVLCLETENFRINIDESNPIFDGVKTLCDKITSDDTAIAVVINPDRDGGFGITTDGSQGRWESLGKTGFEFKMAQKMTKPRKTKMSP